MARRARMNGQEVLHELVDGFERTFGDVGVSESGCTLDGLSDG